MGKLVCTVCKVYYTDFLTDLMKHIRLFHAHQPKLSIKCGIGGCQRTFSSFGTFQNHISAYHRAETNPTNIVEHLSEHNGAVGDDRAVGDDGVDSDDGTGTDDGTGENDDDSDNGNSKYISMNV